MLAETGAGVHLDFVPSQKKPQEQRGWTTRAGSDRVQCPAHHSGSGTIVRGPRLLLSEDFPRMLELSRVHGWAQGMLGSGASLTGGPSF